MDIAAVVGGGGGGGRRRIPRRKNGILSLPSGAQSCFSHRRLFLTLSPVPPPTRCHCSTHLSLSSLLLFLIPVVMMIKRIIM